jgi:hypothetical protein
LVTVNFRGGLLPQSKNSTCLVGAMDLSEIEDMDSQVDMGQI